MSLSSSARCAGVLMWRPSWPSPAPRRRAIRPRGPDARRHGHPGRNDPAGPARCPISRPATESGSARICRPRSPHITCCVSAFLSGSTNPPPKNWFFECKTWTPKCAMDGMTVTVPQDAQQMLVFLAPESGRRFQDPGGRGARPAGRIRADVAGSQPGDAGPLAPGALSVDGARAERRGSRQIEGRADAGTQPGNQGGRSAWIGFRSCRRPA